MEEKMKVMGLREMNSSELQMMGGVALTVWSDVFGKIKAAINFIADYIPKIVKGFKDGFAALGGTN